MKKATRFEYQGNEYMIAARGGYGFEIHERPDGFDYVERTDYVHSMYRQYLKAQQRAEVAKWKDARATQDDASGRV